MSYELIHRGAAPRWRSARAELRVVARHAWRLSSPAYKRASVPAPPVSAPMTSVHSCGGRWSRPDVLLEVTGAGGLP